MEAPQILLSIHTIFRPFSWESTRQDLERRSAPHLKDRNNPSMTQARLPLSQQMTLSAFSIFAPPNFVAPPHNHIAHQRNRKDATFDMRRLPHKPRAHPAPERPLEAMPRMLHNRLRDGNPPHDPLHPAISARRTHRHWRLGRQRQHRARVSAEDA